MPTEIRQDPLFIKIAQYVPESTFDNPAHDFSHCIRVAQNAITIARAEGGSRTVLLAAALLHDIGNLPKNHPQAHMSAELSVEKSLPILQKLKFSKEEQDLIVDAIRCHSFSRGLIPQTLEGKILQDADRLDALGAIGTARTFATGTTFNNKLYSLDDPFAKAGRQPNDKTNSVDHFFVKLFKLPAMMQTKTGKLLAEKRLAIMHNFLDSLEQELLGTM